MPATIAHQDRIALVFDFDDTLGQDCTDAVLEHLGLDADAFRDEHIGPLEDDWDSTLARVWGIFEASRLTGTPLTRGCLEEIGRKLTLFDGVTEMFDRLREIADEIVPGVEVEFYVVSGGFAEMLEETPIADEVASLVACQFHFDGPEDDKDAVARFPRRIVTNSEKVHYLLAISKGIDLEGGDSPVDAYRPVERDDLHVPFEQMIYVGDGASDLPAFGMVQERGGIAIGVLEPGADPDDWDYADRIWDARAVENLAEADYTEGAELMRSLELAVRSICHLICLRQLGANE